MKLKQFGLIRREAMKILFFCNFLLPKDSPKTARISVGHFSMKSKNNCLNAMKSLALI